VPVQRISDVIDRLLPGEQRLPIVLEDVGDARLLDRPAVVQNRSAVTGHQARNHVDERAFPAAVRPENAGEGSQLQLQVEAVIDDLASKRLAQSLDDKTTPSCRPVRRYLSVSGIRHRPMLQDLFIGRFCEVHCCLNHARRPPAGGPVFGIAERRELRRLSAQGRPQLPPKSLTLRIFSRTSIFSFMTPSK